MNISKLYRLGFAPKNPHRGFIKSLQGMYVGKIYEVYSDLILHQEIETYDYELDGYVNLNMYVVKCRVTNNKKDWVFFTKEWATIYNVQTLTTEFPNIIYRKDVGFCYIIKSKYGYKIGFSKNIHVRSKLFSVKLPFKWNFIRIYPSEEYKAMEKYLHEFFKNKNLNGEWFTLSVEDIGLIDNLHEKLNTPSNT